MPDAQLAAELDWRALTAAINEIESPWDFITRLLYGRGETLDTEMIEVGVWHGDRRMAPFVRRDGEAIPVEGISEEFRVIQAPNIRIKRPFRPGAVLFKRRVNTPVHVEGGEVRNAVAAHIAREMEYMRSYHTNRLEWMTAQTLEGKITYADENHNFEIDFQRPGTYDVPLAGTDLWDDAASNPGNQFRDAARIMTADGLPNPNIAILGQLAAEAFEENAEVAKKLDNRNITAGTLDLIQRFEASGVRYLGNAFGINWFEYSRSVRDETGALVKLVGDKRCHFIARSPESMFRLYYGAVPELTEQFDAPIRTRIFTKAWKEEDPNRVIALSHSRPLPVPHRPRAVFSFTVLS